MELRLPVDPRLLIEGHEFLRAASRRWLEDPRPLRDGDERLAELALVASDRVLWEPYVCTLGFSSATSAEPVAILADLPFEALFEQRVQPAELAFLRYSSEFLTIPLLHFAGGAYVLERHYRYSSFANSVPNIECIQSCLRDYTTEDELVRCMRDCCDVVD